MINLKRNIAVLLSTGVLLLGAGFVCDYNVYADEEPAQSSTVETKIATVTTTNLRVRKGPSTDTSILALVNTGETFTLLEEAGEWYKISYKGQEAYIHGDYAYISTGTEQEKNLGQKVVDYALQFVGNPYVYGGTSLTKGADCSGFVMNVYKNFGISLPRTSSLQGNSGKYVNGLQNAKPGDLIWYSGHIAIYMGDGKIVHAANERLGITVSSVYFKSILGIRRIE